jgi:hypothetical protein
MQQKRVDLFLRGKWIRIPKDKYFTLIFKEIWDAQSWTEFERMLRNFLNDDHRNLNDARNIGRDSQVTASFSYKFIVSWITISRIRGI